MMQNVWTLLWSLGLFLCTSAAVYAAADARVDRSGVYVWAFLGICAVIVVAQLYPILRDALRGSEAEEMERKTIHT